MLASIHPLGERGRKQRWSVTVAAYLAGSVLGAGLIGGLAGLVGDLVGLSGRSSAVLAGVAVAVLVLAATGAALDLRLGGLRVPTLHRQVDEEWLERYRGWVYGLSFGFQLGVGVVTVVNSFTVYLTIALAALSGSAPAGVVIGVMFGAVRGGVVLAGANVHQPPQLHALHRRLKRWEPVSHRLAVGIQAVTALGAAAALAIVAS
jgi:MFS family permease